MRKDADDELIPSEGREDKESVGEAKPREGSEWRERLDEERAESDLHEAEKSLPKLDAAEIHNYLGIIEKIIDQGKEGPLLKVLASLDRTIFMDGMRGWWNRLGPEAQSALYHMELGPLRGPPFFKTFVALGFLELKGVSSEKLDKMEAKEVRNMKIAFRIMEFFMPELRPFGPLVEVADKMPGFKKEARSYLIARRAEDALKNDVKNHVTPRAASKKKPSGVVAEERRKFKKAA